MLKIRSVAAPLLFAGAALSTAAVANAEHHQSKAVADLVDGQGQAKGRAILSQHKDGIHVDLKVVGVPAGVHAFHIHTTGVCTGPDFASAGGHWNPGKKQHGHDNPAGAHMGDMPNVTVGADGTGKLKTIVKGAKLDGGNQPLFDADGAAVVVHAVADDYKSDPTGNAGGRLACGVVKVK